MKEFDSLITSDSLLNDNKITELVKSELNKISKKSSPLKYPQEAQDYIFKFIRNFSSELFERDLSVRIPDFIKIIVNTLNSFGIENVNVPVDLIHDLFDYLNSSPQKKKSAQKKKDKRAAVLEAAMKVFSENGFHESHVDDIAERAGVAKGTVYRYFESKEDILKEIIQMNNMRLVDGLNKIFGKDGHILELIKEAIAFYINFFESDKELYRILTHTPWILKDMSDYFYKNVISHLHAVRRKILILSKEGVIKTTDFYTVFYGIFGFIDGVMQKWFRRNCEYSLKDELPVIIEVLFYGFVNQEKRLEKYV